ncbi:glycine N-methyltransferase-like [Amphibalanus amphitrite]|uniref:glycine N-methyltransferase-like n=1 Tax=Amphibalanus amphitrite TaxID=1232801 RepID=UPI001C90C38F|nr:glycine N-methyltransferase-like [Amphibalanus amphitrite]
MVLELDQYSDGKAARLWNLYIGDQSERTRHYKQFLKRELNAHSCDTVLDVACGTGIDSVMLIEEGFSVTSCDFSDKMLKCAWNTRWSRRKEPAFDNWDIYEANWLTLTSDLDRDRQYDAVICLGNSFAHLPDLTGNQDSHRLALRNFATMVKPGGILLIDHRNYDYILDNGRAPSKNIYYNSQYVSDINTSVVYQDGSPSKVILDYVMRDPTASTDSTLWLDNQPPPAPHRTAISANQKDNEFTLTYYPHRVASFRALLEEAFDHRATVTTLGDFQPLEHVQDPAFYIHVVHKSEDSQQPNGDHPEEAWSSVSSSEE